MKILNEQEIIRIMKEEWEAKVKSLSEKVDLILKTKVDGKEINPIDSDLKVRHKKSQILYTVDSVSPQDVILVTPEGEKFMISAEELEKDYESD
jgi:cell division protein YceG involved in septum cleavage